MIDDVFNELKQLGAVHSCTDFSRDWLGMEDSYMRGLRNKHRQPSAKVMARCAVKLRHASTALNQSSTPQVKAVGRKLQQMAESCIDELLNASITC